MPPNPIALAVKRNKPHVRELLSRAINVPHDFLSMCFMRSFADFQELALVTISNNLYVIYDLYFSSIRSINPESLIENLCFPSEPMNIALLDNNTNRLFYFSLNPRRNKYFSQ